MASADDETTVIELNNVRHNKVIGLLRITNKSVKWKDLNEDSFSVSFQYKDVKNQKISPEGKSKIQLQLILLDLNSYTFHFVNPKGPDAQKADRNQSKEIIAQLVVKSRKKQPDELMEKKRILEENPHLKELYMNLVPTDIMSSEIFWKEIADQYKQVITPELDTGVSGSFLADIKPQTDGTNGKVMYNLTPDIMLAIFKTYPAVKKKHHEYVPHQMTESEFWTRFFQSHYYSTHSTLKSDSVFYDCASYDDKEWKRDLNNMKNDPLYDLTDIYEDKPLEFNDELNSASKSGANHIHATMIKRFNLHSLNILKAQVSSEKEKLEQELEKQQKNNPLTNGHNSHSVPKVPDQIENKSKKMRLDEKLHYDDLDVDKSANVASLVIHQKNRYLDGPFSGNNKMVFYGGVSTDELPVLHHELSCKIRAWKPNLYEAQSSSRANSVVNGLFQESTSQQFTLITSKPNSNNNNNINLPSEVHTELVKIYRSFGELLRHFWFCFPARTPILQEKLHRMHATLCKYHETSIRNFQQVLLNSDRNNSKVMQSLMQLEHIQEMFLIATGKYENWKAKRS